MEYRITGKIGDYGQRHHLALWVGTHYVLACERSRKLTVSDRRRFLSRSTTWEELMRDAKKRPLLCRDCIDYFERLGRSTPSKPDFAKRLQKSAANLAHRIQQAGSNTEQYEIVKHTFPEYKDLLGLLAKVVEDHKSGRLGKGPGQRIYQLCGWDRVSGQPVCAEIHDCISDTTSEEFRRALAQKPKLNQRESALYLVRWQPPGKPRVYERWMYDFEIFQLGRLYDPKYSNSRPQLSVKEKTVIVHSAKLEYLTVDQLLNRLQQFGGNALEEARKIEYFVDDDEDMAYIAAFHNNRLIGFLNFTTDLNPQTEEEELLLFAIWVHEDFRGLGLAKRLCLRWVEHLKQMGTEKVVITYELGIGTAVNSTRFVQDILEQHGIRSEVIESLD